jgi:hypothetical protein
MEINNYSRLSLGYLKHCADVSHVKNSKGIYAYFRSSSSDEFIELVLYNDLHKLRIIIRDGYIDNQT